PLAADSLDRDGDELAVLDELLAQRRSTRMVRSLGARLRRAQAAEDISSAADAQKTVRAIPREELVPQLFPQRDLAREDLARQQSLDQVVVAAVAVASSETEHSGHRVRLEHCAHDVRGSAEPVDQRPAPALEVERREGTFRADPLEHLLGDVGVLGEDAWRVPAQVCAEPWVVACEDERKTLVVRL